MPVDRPTFSESWYRVKSMKPQLNAMLQTYRQFYRGEMWHVVRDPKNNQFFRLNDAAYRFVGLMDGRRNVEEVWDLCNDQLGDDAPTQNEVIQLLGQLYTSNLLQAEVPPDAEALFDRYRKRVRKEVLGYAASIMFMRIPMFNPERVLEAWNRVFAWIFTWPGLILWLIWVGFGFSFLIGRQDDLLAEASGLLSPMNLPLMYLGFALLKAVHEFGHGFACKKFGKDNGSGGEVHTMGIMLMVFMPIPYVDASSAWALRSKWQRIIIAAAGMYVEIAVAAAAAIVWAQTSSDSVIHGLAYNMMLVASVTTLVFNINPLLKYDGYYMLSDLLEMPNLQQRSKDFLYYLVKKNIYRVRNPQNPALSLAEYLLFPIYAVASTVYKFVVFGSILLFISQQFFVLGMIAAIACVAMWVFIPLGKFLKFLMTSPELSRTRSWAMVVTILVFGGIGTAIGTIPFPDWERAEGVIEPEQFAYVYAPESGQILTQMNSNSPVEAEHDALVQSSNPLLETELQEMQSKLTLLEVARRQAFADKDPSMQALYDRSIHAQQMQLKRQQQRLQRLTIQSPIDGIWYSPQLDQARGQYLQAESKQPVGMIYSPDMLIRVAAAQEVGPRIHKGMKVSIRIKGRPSGKFSGEVIEVYQAGSKRLPSAALGYQVGGSFMVDSQDREGLTTLEPFFEVLVKVSGKEALPDPLNSVMSAHDQQEPAPTLLSGQRVMVRFDFGKKPLAQQWWRSALQLMQRR